MERSRPEAGFTILEVIYAILIIAALVAIYVVMMDSYRERRMSEQSAKVLMQAARAQEEFFAKEHYYFDAELSGNGGEVYLSTPAGEKTSVRVPSKVVLSLRAVGKDKTAFVGHSFYAGSKVLHRYDSKTGKMTTVSRTQDEAG